MLVSLSPLVGAAFRGAVPDRATGEDATRRRVSALGELLSVLTESHPLAVLIDDMHWSDAESVRIVGALRTRAESSRLLFVLSSRIPDELRSSLGDVEQLALQPLDVAGVAEFLGRLASLPSSGWNSGLVQRLHEVTHGIPLLLIETLQRLNESGALERRDGAWFATSAAVLLEAMPRGSALRARLQTLGDGPRASLARLATLGRPISEEELADYAAGIEWRSHLRELEHRGFIARSQGQVAVWHDEIASGILELVGTDERLSAHAWVAGLISRTARNKGDSTLAAMHALLSADAASVQRVWTAALMAARDRGDERPTGTIARRLFGSNAMDPLVRGALRRTPIRLRLGRYSWLAAALVALIATGLSTGLAVQNHEPSTITIYLKATDSETDAYRITIDPRAPWRTDEPIIATRIAVTESPVHLDSRISALTPLPDGGGWVAARFYPDSGGDEVVFAGKDGRITRPVGAVGDDNGPSLSPDGRYVAFYTRRFDPVEHQSDIVIWDRKDNSIRRLTNSEDDEVGPLWSPDGTRIAFIRNYALLTRAPELCVMFVDGTNQRCTWRGLPVGVSPLGWSSHRSLLVQGQIDGVLYSVLTDEGSATALGPVGGEVIQALGAGLLSCVCIDPSSRTRYLGIARLGSPLDWRRVLLDGRFVDSDRSLVKSVPAPTRFLDRLVMTVADSDLQIDAQDAIRVSGVDNEGDAIPVDALRFESSDPTALSVDGDGTMRSHKLGSVWVRAIAGGWRTDSLEIQVVRPKFRMVREETFDEPLSVAWRVFGDPPATIVVEDGRSAMLPGGDGVYPTGIYLKESLVSNIGIGVEVEARLPVDRTKFQSLGLQLVSASDSLALKAWDHRTGAPPISNYDGCSTALPSAEGALGVRQLIVKSSGEVADHGSAPTPPNFYGRTWHRILLQYFPDGRCGLEVDGVSVAVTRSPRATLGHVRLFVTGHSVGTRILVRRLSIWEGVRADLRRPSSP